MELPVRTRILEATYACIARYGLAKTTMEDAAREAGLSRATVYRHFPGGRDELVREVIVVGDGAASSSGWPRRSTGIRDFADLLEEALLFAHDAIEGHEVLQKVLQTEPERLLPTLTVESDRIRRLISRLPRSATSRTSPGCAPGSTRRRPPTTSPACCCRGSASPGGWDLTDRAQVRTLVGTEFLAGILDDA